MLKSRLRLLLPALLVHLIGFEPLAATVAQATSEEAGQLVALEAAALRIGVAPLFLIDPDAYLAPEARAATARRDAALAELDRRYRPAPTVLARVKAEAGAV